MRCNTTTAKCTECAGTGNVQIGFQRFEQCEDCEGSGVVPQSDPDRCTACKGVKRGNLGGFLGACMCSELKYENDHGMDDIDG